MQHFRYYKAQAAVALKHQQATGRPHLNDIVDW